MDQYNGYRSLDAYRAALWRLSFEGSADELWMLALASGCRFRVYLRRRQGEYEKFLTVGVRGPVVRRLLWIRAGPRSRSHHYNLLLPRQATEVAPRNWDTHGVPPPHEQRRWISEGTPGARGDADWMLDDEDVRRRLYHGPRGAPSVA